MPDEAAGIWLYRRSMRGAKGRLGALGTGLVVVALALCGCATTAAEPTEVPTFPTSAEVSGTTVPEADDGVLPNDCAEILPAGDLEAVLGLPLGSVGMRTTIGVPEPSVGRIERVACRYFGTGGGPARGRTLLDINASAYSDADASAKQWRVNADAEDGGRRDLAIGSASAVLVERRGEAVLMVVNGGTNLTVVLPDQPLPGNRPRADALVDLALRVLPAVSTTPTPLAPAGTVSGSPGAAS